MTKLKPGPTGENVGEMGPYDRGGLMTAMGIIDDRIVVDFGTSLTFLAMTKSEAMAFAAGLISYATSLPDEKAN